MIVLLDVDGVIADFVGESIRRFAPDRCEADVTEWDMSKCLRVPDLLRKIAAHVTHDRMCRDLPAYVGAREFVANLQRCVGASNVHACTAPFNAAWLSQRAEWLEDIGIPLKLQHHTGGKELGMIHADVLIDDKPESCFAFSGAALLFDRPWNRTHEGYRRVFSYDDCLAAVEALR